MPTKIQTRRNNNIYFYQAVSVCREQRMGGKS